MFFLCVACKCNPLDFVLLCDVLSACLHQTEKDKAKELIAKAVKNRVL